MPKLTPEQKARVKSLTQRIKRLQKPVSAKLREFCDEDGTVSVDEFQSYLHELLNKTIAVRDLYDAHRNRWVLRNCDSPADFLAMDELNDILYQLREKLFDELEPAM